MGEKLGRTPWGCLRHTQTHT